MLQENKQYKIECPYCGHKFIEYFDVTGYSYTISGPCCPKCGADIEINISKDGTLEKALHGGNQRKAQNK